MEKTKVGKRKQNIPKILDFILISNYCVNQKNIDFIRRKKDLKLDEYIKETKVYCLHPSWYDFGHSSAA